MKASYFSCSKIKYITTPNTFQFSVTRCLVLFRNISFLLHCTEWLIRICSHLNKKTIHWKSFKLEAVIVITSSPKFGEMKLWKQIHTKISRKAEVSVETGRTPQPCNNIYYSCARPAAIHGLAYQTREMILNRLSAFLTFTQMEQKVISWIFLPNADFNKSRIKYFSSHTTTVKCTWAEIEKNNNNSTEVSRC